jgi:hypothetical protein
MKVCLKCNLLKDEKLFSKLKTGKDGLRPRCKECIKFESATYYVNNREIINNKNKQYWNENKTLLNGWQKQYYIDHKRDKSKYYSHEKRRIRENNRLKTDPNFKLRKCINRMIKRRISKNGSIVNNINYSFQDLREHLENQFEPWMNWSNWGTYSKLSWNDHDTSTWTWQIDHIIPHSTFKYTSMEDQAFKDCWKLSNLRPYSAKQNQLDGISKIRHRK